MRQGKKSVSALLIITVITFFLSFSALANQVTEKLDHLFNTFASPNSPGVAVAVIRDDQVIFKKAYGMASLELGVANSTKTLFRIGSVSKQFTAASIAMLVKDKKLHLEDPVTKFFPELPQEVYGPVSVSHMIHHTSGIRDSEALYPYMGIEYSRWYTYDMLLNLLARQKALDFRPGEKIEYSNSAYTLLALIVERVSGKPFHIFVKETFFDPLGMKNTYIQTSYDTFIPNRAAGYRPGEKGYRNWMTNNQLVGHDAVYSSVEDMARWTRAFFNGQLDREIVRIMTAPATFNDGSANNYAYGLVVSNYKGLKTLEHGGWYVGYTAYLLMFPEQQFSIICLANTVQGSRERDALKIADIYLAGELAASLDRLRKKAKKVDKRLLSSLHGSYLSEEMGGRLNLEIKEGKLRQRGAKWFFEPSPLENNTFINYERRYKVKAVPGTRKDRIAIDIYVAMGKIDRFFKVDDVSFEKEKLPDFTGEYRSEELQASASVKIVQEKLIIKISLQEGELSQVGTDDFVTKGGRVKFFRSGQGKISGFKLSAYGFREVIFTPDSPSTNQ